MKTTFTFVVSLILVACGEEKETILHYQDDPACLSCNVDIPEPQPISDTDGSVQSNLPDLTFFCTMGEECQDVQSVLIYNFTQETTIVYIPVIGPYDTGGIPIESGNFHVVQNNEFPFFLEPGHSLEISVRFDWTTTVQFATLVITTQDETLHVNLIGKMFEPMGE
jgi:hypothetical protein